MSQNAHPIHITLENFEQEVLASDLPVVVDFWAPWCAPCRAVGPVLDQLAAKYEGRVKVAKINTEEQPELASAFRIRSIPTLIAIQGREVVDAQIGFSGPRALEAWFERLAAGDAGQRAQAKAS